MTNTLQYCTVAFKLAKSLRNGVLKLSAENLFQSIMYQFSHSLSCSIHAPLLQAYHPWLKHGSTPNLHTDYKFLRFPDIILQYITSFVSPPLISSIPLVCLSNYCFLLQLPPSHHQRQIHIFPCVTVSCFFSLSHGSVYPLPIIPRLV